MSVHVSGDTVFATMWHYVNRQGGTSEAWLVAIGRLTGREFWRVRLPYQGSGVLIEGAPVLHGNLVIVHTVSARTYAIDRTTQKVAWEFTVPAATLSTIAGAELYGDIVYVDGGDRHIYALRAGDGSVLWSAAFPTQADRDLLVTERRITFVEGRMLYVLDRQTGKQIAAVTQPRTSDPLFASAAAFANGVVFVTVADAAWCFDEP
jgi:outer membrane protein assembly factor BamB